MDIYREIKRDHRELKAMLGQLASLRRGDDYRLILLPEIRNSLSSHARAEEAALFHSLRHRGPEGAKIVLSRMGEHIELETILWALELVERGGGNWKPLARKLAGKAARNIKNEEGETFQAARLAFTWREALKIGRVYKGLKADQEQRGELRSTVGLMLNFLPAAAAFARSKRAEVLPGGRSF